MSAFATASFSTAAKENASINGKNSNTLVGNNVGQGGGGRGGEPGGVSVGEWWVLILLIDCYCTSGGRLVRGLEKGRGIGGREVVSCMFWYHFEGTTLAPPLLLLYFS